MLMQGSRAIAEKEKQASLSESLPSLPCQHTVINNKKDQLHNDILSFLNNKDVSFRGRTEADATGK